jgi:hypothetical protein
MGSPRECTRILGLDGYRVEQIEWEAEGSAGFGSKNANDLEHPRAVAY